MDDAVDLIDSPVEGMLVCFGRPRKTAQLANKLQGASTDFFIRGWRFKIVQRLDASTHEVLIISATKETAAAAFLWSSIAPPAATTS